MTLNEYQEKRERERAKALDLLEHGVIFQDIESVYIDDTVTVGKGTYIGASVTLSGKTKIGENCEIYQNTRIKDSILGDEVTVDSSVILESNIGSLTSVGPFAYIRPGSTVGQNCKVGDFVEIKNSNLGDGTKSAHLTYIGDADVGSDVNIGCGVVFVNYDGTSKHRTIVGDRCFIGCNANLVAPVKVGDDAYIAAGSTLTKDVPSEALAVARARQENLEGWAVRSGLYDKSRK